MPSAKQLLFISAHYLDAVALQAGHKIAWRDLLLLKENYDVHFLGLRNPLEKQANTESLPAVCKTVTFVETCLPKMLWKMLRFFYLPVLVAARFDREFLRQLKLLLQTHNFDAIVVEWAEMAVYAKFLPAKVQAKLIVHDVLSDVIKSRMQQAFFLKPLWWLEYLRCRKFEQNSYKLFEKVYALCDKDVATLKAIIPTRDVLLLPPYFTIYAESQSKTYQLNEELRLLFWGSFVRHENVTGALWLISKVMPLLWQVNPGIKLILLGANPPPALKKLASDKIIVTGFVAKPEEYFQQAHIAVLPLIYGAGIKIKVLECLAAGLPVITNNIGAAGIPATKADGLLVCEQPREFQNTIQYLMNTSNEIRRLSLAAAKWGRDFTQNNVEILQQELV